MANRTIIVAAPSTSVAKKITDFSGSTWGELKQHPIVSSLLSPGLDAILNPGNVSLVRNDAALPSTGDFRVFLVATKNKAGITSDDAIDIGDAIAEAIIEASRLASKTEVNNLKNDLIEAIENFFGVDLESDYCEECEEALEEARELVED